MDIELDELTKLIRPEIQQMKAYHVPESIGLIKLDAMENPYSWPEEMKQEWLSVMSTVEPNRYPDPAAKEMVAEMRACFDIDESMGLVLGNGSDELIQLILMALNDDACVMSPAPSFVMYQHIAKTLGLSFQTTPLNVDFSLDIEAMLVAIEKYDPAVIFLAYPNNPTANLFADSDLIKVINASSGLVVIDEAYQPFAQKSFLAEAKKYPNVLVMRTVSKLGLAGVRLGYVVGHKAITNQFEKIRLPYNINVFTQETARFAFKNYPVLEKQAKKICAQRELMFDALSQIESIEVFPSKSNFILFRILNKKAQIVFDSVKQAGILIKNMGVVAGLPEECLRVTVGSSEQNQQFITVLQEILSED